jgi:hypothetical protein
MTTEPTQRGEGELLACPFCGAPATIFEREDDCWAPRPHNWYRVECSECGVGVECESSRWWSASVAPPKTAEDFVARDKAIAAWNRRPASPEPTQRGEGELDENLPTILRIQADGRVQPEHTLMRQVANDLEVLRDAISRRTASPVGVSEEQVEAAWIAFHASMGDDYPHEITKSSVRASLQAALSPKGEAPEGWQRETGWLIERFAHLQASSGRPCYWSLRLPTGDYEDPNQALRFARKEDAEAFILSEKFDPASYRATEHIFIAPIEGKQP